MSEAAFLGAICANPDDDTARLVFADWLDEHGRPARAEFIRAQIELAHTDEADPRYPALLARSRRCGVLTGPALRTDLEHVRGGKVAFRRGFVNSLEIAPAALLALPSTHFETFPLEQLRLMRPEHSHTEAGQALAARPELAKLRVLAFAADWNTNDLDPLLTGPSHLANLRALKLSELSRTSAEHLRRIIPRLALPALDSLALHVGHFASASNANERTEPDGWYAYLPTKTSLRRLHFSGSAEDDHNWVWPGPNLDWLIPTRHWRTLEIADVRMAVSRTDNTHFVAPAPPGDVFNHLKGSRLTRVRCSGYETGVWQLAEVPNWGQLDEVAFHCALHPGKIESLAGTTQSRRLRRLTLDGGAYGNTSADREFTRSVLGDDPWPNLRHLSTANCPPDLLRGAFCRHLLRLDVGYMGASPVIDSLASVPLPEVRHLAIGFVRRDENVRYVFAPLVGATKMPNLCTLILNIEQPLTPPVLRRLAENKHLPHLSLVGAGTSGHMREWWVLGNGVATPVSSDVLPLDEDWWEPDPLADWFW